jgi:hypothetical protein
MGGLPTVVPPKPTDAEITARLIEIGRTPMPDPHTVWVVEDPSTYFPFYKDRSNLDNVCYAMPVSHFEAYPFSTFNLERSHIAFYHYKDREAAVEDATARLAKIGRGIGYEGRNPAQEEREKARGLQEEVPSHHP